MSIVVPVAPPPAACRGVDCTTPFQPIIVALLVSYLLDFASIQRPDIRHKYTLPFTKHAVQKDDKMTPQKFNMMTLACPRYNNLWI